VDDKFHAAPTLGAAEEFSFQHALKTLGERGLPRPTIVRRKIFLCLGGTDENLDVAIEKVTSPVLFAILGGYPPRLAAAIAEMFLLDLSSLHGPKSSLNRRWRYAYQYGIYQGAG
jgi:hypothetical protein